MKVPVKAERVLSSSGEGKNEKRGSQFNGEKPRDVGGIVLREQQKKKTAPGQKNSTGWEKGERPTATASWQGKKELKEKSHRGKRCRGCLNDPVLGGKRGSGPNDRIVFCFGRDRSHTQKRRGPVSQRKKERVMSRFP